MAFWFYFFKWKRNSQIIAHNKIVCVCHHFVFWNSEVAMHCATSDSRKIKWRHTETNFSWAIIWIVLIHLKILNQKSIVAFKSNHPPNIACFFTSTSLHTVIDRCIQRGWLYIIERYRCIERLAPTAKGKTLLLTEYYLWRHITRSDIYFILEHSRDVI